MNTVNMVSGFVSFTSNELVMACQIKSVVQHVDNNGEVRYKHASLQTEQLFSARGLEPSNIQHLASDDRGLGSRTRNL